MIDMFDIPFGMRFVGYWGKDGANQISVKTFDDIKNIVEEHNGLDNLGISMCTYKDNMPYLLFLPFDFDSTDLKESWIDSIQLYNKIVKKGYSTCLTFSGNKGFHVFIKVVPKIYPKKLIKYVQKMFRYMLTLNTMDMKIMGDYRRLMRIPNTLNMNGDMCKVVDYTDGKLLDLDSLIDDKLLEKMKKEEEEYNTLEGEIFHDYPCVDNLICNEKFWRKHHPRKRYEPAQEIRFVWAILKLSEGLSIEEIVEEAEKFNWDDYEEDKTIYQINHIAGGGYAPQSCSTLRDLGFCVIDDCPHKSKNAMLRELGLKL